MVSEPQNHVLLLENAQRRFTPQRIIGMKNLDYEDRLKSFKLASPGISADKRGHDKYLQDYIYIYVFSCTSSLFTLNFVFWYKRSPSHTTQTIS